MNKVVYNNFAASAEKYATVPAEGSSSYQSGGDLLNEEARELINYASFTGKGINLLDGTLEFAENDDNVGYISKASSNSQRVFSPSVDLVIDLGEGVYSAPGITLHFWQNYCTAFSVRWFQNDIQLMWSSFYPSFSEEEKAQEILTFYGEQAVENFNKIIISFDRSELPNQFVKLVGIDLGKQSEITDFHSNINMFFEIDPDGADVPGATCEFVAQIETFEPEEMQVLYVYDKNKCFGKFTVREVMPNGKNRYLIKGVDDTMRLDGTDFPAILQGEYTSDEVAEKIMTVSGLTVDTSQIESKSLYGFIESDKTGRYALAMLCFGLGAFATGYGSKKLTLRIPKERRTKLITADRILGKATYRKISPYTSIILKSFEGDFKTVEETRKVTVANKKASLTLNEKKFDKYSLIGDIDERINELAKTAFLRNEISVYIELADEELGDVLRVETPYNGEKIGIIKSMEISLGHKTMAMLTLIEREFEAGGGAG